MSRRVTEGANNEPPSATTLRPRPRAIPMIASTIAHRVLSPPIVETNDRSIFKISMGKRST